ncbi:Nif3-like dinuclear metal center hexameric protein [Fulvivirga lutea]|uniref:GTP cyclohydrolase 1 type 2 homolog n=1 Tax=Fulvivirga lutea TaxID=2810512 RepID=A0A975A0H8_9BACT|nr:Nif3-like dinuclear metal center hexameric protein [Fulvivirga lutea]QSE96836.1 Nif3-like dinuclear metal center hexameric protein [Fulvivirga lutea]
MTRIKDIITHLESIAPLSYQESYDNSGLLVGSQNDPVNGILITLDVTEDVVEEAINLKSNLIIAHHPIIFKGLKSITGKNYVERTVLKAIQNNIAIYAIHTNLDNIINGVNHKIASLIGLQNLEILLPKGDTLIKLVTYSPKKSADKVKQGLFEAGAGNIGNYSECAFTSEGTGQFTPNDKANPTIGSNNKAEKVDEVRIEVIVPKHDSRKVIQKLNAVHPYEEVAYYILPISNANQEVGSGMIGELEEEISTLDFLKQVKSIMKVGCVRHTKSIKDKIKKVAVCGGSGSFLLSQAKRQGADVFITADFKYHEFFDAEDNIVIADIGHYESEQFTKELIHELLSEKFTTFALNLSNTVTNPISYL